MNQEPKQNYTFALIVVFIVCFLIGFITTMNNSMIAFCSEAFHLTAQQGQYVNTAFYGAYLLSIPFAFLMSKIGYKNTLILGLAVSGVGFVINSIGINSAIAAGANVYAIFLASMCLVAMGVVMLQNVANPYVMVLGSPEKGAFRMTLSQALNSVATTVAPLFITYVIINGKAPAPEYVPGPFLGLGIFTVIICLILVFLKLPRIDEGAQAEAAGEHREYKDSVFDAENRREVVTIQATLLDETGALQSLLAAISAAGAGIVTINQSTPENGAAQVAVAVRTGTMQMTLEELLVRLSRQRTVVEVHRGL